MSGSDQQPKQQRVTRPEERGGLTPAESAAIRERGEAIEETQRNAAKSKRRK